MRFIYTASLATHKTYFKLTAVAVLMMLLLTFIWIPNALLYLERTKQRRSLSL